MKAYTDINQSKKLAEILPLESADGYWDFQIDGYNLIADKLGYYKNDSEIPCWSLTALLEIIKKPTAFDLLINGRGYRCHCTDKQEGKFYGTNDYCETPVDACVEVIIKLHEQKLL